MMSAADIFLVDLQDVGCRIYTFVTTLLYLLEAASAPARVSGCSIAPIRWAARSRG